MDTGRKRKPTHVDEPHLGNVVIANAGNSIYFADSVLAFDSNIHNHSLISLCHVAARTSGVHDEPWVS